MSLLRLFGKKHVDLLSQWIGTGVIFGTAATTGLIYFTDWKLVLQYLPYYNGKFPKDEES